MADPLVEKLARKAFHTGAEAARYYDKLWLVERGYGYLADAIGKLPIPTEENIAEDVAAMRARKINEHPVCG